MQIRAQKTDFSKSISLAILEYSQKSGKLYVAEPVVMMERDDGLSIQPTLQLEPAQAQQLMDDLWECGVRPTEGTGSAGAMSAVQAHLKDLRKLLSAAVEVNLDG